MACLLHRFHPSPSHLSRPIQLRVLATSSLSTRRASTSAQQPESAAWTGIIPSRAGPRRAPEQLQKELEERAMRLRQEEYSEALAPTEGKFVFPEPSERERAAAESRPPDEMWLQLKPILQQAVHNTQGPVQQEWEKKRAPQKTATVPATQYTGRSVPVIDGNLSRAWNTLQAICQRNRVRQEARAQEHYVKPTKMRRHLRSVRHRRRFAELVRKKVQLVQAIKRRGG